MDLYKRNNHIRDKKSFTLFEVLISLIILSITISGILKLQKAPNSLEVYYELIDAQNYFEQFGTINNTDNLKFEQTIKK